MVFVVTFKLAGLSLEGFWEQRLWPQDAKRQIAWEVQQHGHLAACCLFCLPLQHYPECPAEIKYTENGAAYIVKAFLPREPPLPNPERIHTVPF